MEYENCVIFAVVSTSFVGLHSAGPGFFKVRRLCTLEGTLALTIALSILLKIVFYFFKTLSCFYTVLLILYNNDKLYLLSSAETYF